MKPITERDPNPAMDPGVMDVTPETIGERNKVADIRDFLRKRDRNAPQRRYTPDNDPKGAA